MDWLIDTNILIDHLRGTPRATTFLRNARKQQTLWISVITVAEIHAGQGMKEAETARDSAAISQTLSRCVP
ncbi:MAG TPA: PIN domain-containing protein [Blastocatellia bacterium]|nr:PIN domain-containing protein [Blastocatellia bacterium]